MQKTQQATLWNGDSNGNILDSLPINLPNLSSDGSPKTSECAPAFFRLLLLNIFFMPATEAGDDSNPRIDPVMNELPEIAPIIADATDKIGPNPKTNETAAKITANTREAVRVARALR
jgi:hypothetical protein